MQLGSLQVPCRVGANRARHLTVGKCHKTWAIFLLAMAALLLNGRNALAGTLVSFEFSDFSTVMVDLFDDATPITVANFLRYVDPDNNPATNDGRYNGSIIHRVDTSLGVIQGGGFYPDGSSVTTFGNINAEVSLLNKRGTLAMARGSALNSASSQWFFNTKDNSTSLGPLNNGGYTVFGWVVGGGMSAVDSIAAVPTFAYNQPFNQIPLLNFTQNDFNNGVDPTTHTVVLTGVSIVKQHPSFQNPLWNVDVNNDNALTQDDYQPLLDGFVAHSNHIYQPVGPFGEGDYLDVSGDDYITAWDLLRVYNALIMQNSGEFVGPQAASPAVTVVPEPSSVALAIAGILALLGRSIMRRRGRR